MTRRSREAEGLSFSARHFSTYGVRFMAAAPEEVEAGDFAALSLPDQKRFLLELLDKNMLYVNLCDLEDAEFAVSPEDRAFNRSFYREA